MDSPHLPVVVIGLLGTTLDVGRHPDRWQNWRPSVSICRQPDVIVSRFELLHGNAETGLAELVRRDIASVSPETSVVLHPVQFGDPWDFEQVYEALFAFAQTVLDPTRDARVVCPNPFYQIYEGAALLAGATPVYGSPESWAGVQLLYACSPANPTGRVMKLNEWRELFELSERHGFAIASDECYSEIYCGEPPLGALQAAHRLGRSYDRLVAFSSLSKRSNAPGMRSGFVAGDAELIRKFLLYRTYHGSAMSLAVQAASAAAWRDERHVEDNRGLYAEKYRAVLPMVRDPLKTEMPEGGFYLWVRTPIDDTEFARRLHGQYNVLVLPGSFLARKTNTGNPGANHVRIALVPPLAECVEAMERIMRFAGSL